MANANAYNRKPPLGAFLILSQLFSSPFHRVSSGLAYTSAQMYRDIPRAIACAADQPSVLV